MKKLKEFYSTDIGENADYLYETCSKFSDSIFIDLGVRSGISSEILLLDSLDKNNQVYGVDVDWQHLSPSVNNHPRFTKISGDSVTVGKYWDKNINGLFVDTFHIKEQVLTELYFWYPHIIEGGFIAFHDTNWPEGKNDIYGGVVWERVEEAIKLFFGTETLNFEDNYIKMSNYPDSWGMTIVEVKEKFDYISQIKTWKEIFEKRNHLINIFWNENNKSHLQIDLNLYV